MGRGSDFHSCHIILRKMSTFQQRITCHPKKQLSMAHTQEKIKQSIETYREEAKMLDLLDKDFK